MMTNNKNIFIAVIVLLVAGALIYFWSGKEDNSQIIGGERDSNGCLVAAGYSFDAEVEACVRAFEMTPDIKEAARIAVVFSGTEKGLTVESFNSYEEMGAYDINLRKLDDTRETVYVRNGMAYPPRQINVYFYNSEKDKDSNDNILCSKQGLVALRREIPITLTPIQDAINLLLLGELSEAERAENINTEFPLEGLELVGANLKDGVLTLDFKDPMNKTSGGSCRAGILWNQIEATALQFPEVTSVHFTPEELFQP
jgi:hypothetical protein